MVVWVKRLARILSFAAFFAVFFSGIDPLDPFNVTIAVAALAKGFAAAMLFWIAGFILGDIVFKGILESVIPEQEDPLEGGLVQWFQDEKKRTLPETIIEAGKKKNEAAPAAK